MKIIINLFLLIGYIICGNLFAQEHVKPLNGNIHLINYKSNISPNNTYSNKTASVTDTLPFFEDFYYAPNSPYPSGNHWKDSSVYVNTGFAIAPPSIGVATFDGLNKKGYPYNLSAIENIASPADTLTSLSFNLFSQSGYTFSPADSLGMSFLYQREGFGDNPEVNDSLILDFYKPLYPVVTGTTTSYGAWFRTWSSRGSNSLPTDSAFKRAFIRISDTAYFHDGFKFRFRNKACAGGSLDHWHLDYINLKINYFKTDTTYNEIAFGYMPRPILKNYSSMPYYQYKATEMGSKFSNFIRNNAVGIVKNTNYEYSIHDNTGALLSSYGAGASNTGNANPFVTRGWDSVLTHKNPPVNYTISPLTDSTFFYVKHVISSIPDIWKYNDTIYQRLEFNNYYSYDDGSAEVGWYLHAYGAKTALRYTLNVTDTVRALDIYFDPVGKGNLVQASSFRMCIWGNAINKPGTLIRKDSLMYPKYLQFGHNKIPRYFFSSPLVLGPGTYYFGLQQTTIEGLNIGLDRNFNHQDALFFDTNGYWEPSTSQEARGSLMIHPVLGHAARAMVGINETENKTKEGLIKIYPNPANDKLFISTIGLEKHTKYEIELYSVLGQQILSAKLENGESEINLREYTNGLYFVILKQNNTILSQQKFIISR